MSPQTIPQAVCVLLCILLFQNAAEAVPTANISEHPIVIVVSFDGFRSDYFDKVATPALNALKASGVSVPYMEPVFPSKTFPNHQSIATGVYAETHGIVDNEVWDPKYNKTLSGGSNDPGFWNYHPEILPLWIHNEMGGEGRASGTLMWAGSSQPYGPNNDNLPTYYFPGYDRNLPWEDRVDMAISWMTNSSSPANLVYLYFDEPDSRGHAFGPNAPETITEVANADRRTGHLVERLQEEGLFDKVNLIMLSDHGMKEVTARHIINITDMIDSNLVEREHGGTPFLHLTPKAGRGDELYNALVDQSRSNNFTMWRKEDMDERYHYGESRRVMDFVALADPGYAFDDFYASIDYYNDRWNFTANDSREYGVHGYDNKHESMRAYFIAHGPAFKKNFTHDPIRNIDIVPLISTIVGIPIPPTNGSLERVINMLEPEFLSSHGGYHQPYHNNPYLLKSSSGSRVHGWSLPDILTKLEEKTS